MAGSSVITDAVASAADASVAAASVSDCVASAARVELVDVDGMGALVSAADVLVSAFEAVVELV